MAPRLRSLSSFRRQRGIALLTALLLVSLATVAVVAMTASQQLGIRRLENTLRSDQAWQYALGGELWARGILARDYKDDGQERVDDLSEEWAIRLPPLPIEGGEIAGALVDLQGLFNLNNLETPPQERQGEPPPTPWLDLFRRLLRLLEMDERIAEAVQDWIDTDTVPRFPGGAEDGDYFDRKPPYRAGNGPLADVSELRTVAGIDAEGYARLQAVVTTLPEKGVRINVNTAPALLIQALDDAIDASAATELVRRREKKTYVKVDDFIQELESIVGEDLKDPEGIKSLIAVNSHYFQVDSQVILDRARLRLLGLLHRDDEGRIRIVRRWRELF